MRHPLTASLALGLLSTAGCNESSTPANQTQAIEVRGPEQERLHTLDAFNLAIALKRAIYDAGFTCKQVTDGGFVAKYENLDMWTAKCSDSRDWAIFAGPDGSAQVRDCKDVAGSGLPSCAVARKPEGSFDQPG
ncbi:MAG: hypothetical protein ABIS23_02720 [Sphingomicrobium sp.]